MIASVDPLGEILDLLNERIARYRVHDHVVLYCNRSWATQHGAQPEDVVGRPLDDFLGADELEGLRQQLARLGPAAPFLADPSPRPCPANPEHWVEWTDLWLEGPDGAEVIAVGRDITERRNAEVQLAASEERFRNLAELSADVVWHLALRPEPHLSYLSPSVEAITGWDARTLTADRTVLRDALDADSLELVDQIVSGGTFPARADLTVRRPDGGRVVLEVQTVRLPDGAQGVARDVTEVRRQQADLTEQALHDPLTGLANRRLLEDLLGAALRSAEGHDVAVSYLDLDGFKPVNDTHGHAFGDSVLIEVARRIKDELRDADVVARVGGDEFVFVHQTPWESARDVRRRVSDVVAEPMYVAGVELVVHATIGTVLAEPGQHVADVLAAADAAMYRAKKRRAGGQRDEARQP